MLEVINVSKTFGKNQVLDGVNLSLRVGTITGLIGPNGCGKTTLLKILLTLIRKYGGNVIYKQGASIAGIIEDPGFFGFLTGRENLIYLMNGRGMPHLDDYVEVLKMTEYIDQKVGKYSRGMRQRLALLYILLLDVDIIILDEPTNGLDPEGIAQFKTLMIREKEKGKCILISSHLLNELAFCDEVYLLYQGKVKKIMAHEHADKTQMVFTFVSSVQAKQAALSLEIPYEINGNELLLILNKKDVPEWVKKLAPFDLVSVYEKDVSLVDLYLKEIVGDHHVS